MDLVGNLEEMYLLEIPRFVAPFGLSKLVPKEMSPRTLFSIGSSVQKNIGLRQANFYAVF